MIGGIALWEILANIGVIDSFIASQPSRIVKTFLNLSGNDLLTHLGVTCFETIIGFELGAVLGVLLSLGITPIIEGFSVRVELSFGGGILSLLFGVLTGTVFGFYPALKASQLIPVVALNHE